MYNKYIIPPYQSGGLILPQYSGAQQSYALPGSGMQTLNTFMQIDQQSQQRYMQQQQLNMQRSQQTQNMLNSSIEMQLRRSQQERVNKQIDLQNKKFEYQQMKDNLDLITEGLAIGSEEFIEADRAKIDALLAPEKEKLSSLDTRDTEAIFKQSAKLKMVKASYANGYKNADALKKAKELLDKNPNDELLDFATKNDVLDVDVYEDYTNSKLEWVKAVNQFSKTGDVSVLDNARQYREALETTQKMVSSDLFKEKIEIAKIVQQSKAEENRANADKIRIATEIAKKEAPLKEAQLRFEHEQNMRKGAEFAKWEKDNPNATIEERDIMYDRLFSDKSAQQNQYTSSEQMYAEGYRTNDPGMMDAAMQWKMADNNKTTNVNYTTDGKGIIDKDGSINYGGYGINKDNTWAWGIYGNNQIKRDQIKDEIESGAVIPQGDGSLKIIDDATVMKIFGIEATWGNSDSGDIKAALPGAKKVGGSWIIPKDNVALPQQTNTFDSYFNSPSSGSPATGGLPSYAK
jgi:hypothetical protein